MDNHTLIRVLAVLLLVLVPIVVLVVRWRWARTTWRHRGRWFAEGWYDVQHDRRQELQLEYRRGVEDAWEGRVIKAPTGQAPVTDRTPTDPDVGEKFTITGRRIR